VRPIGRWIEAKQAIQLSALSRIQVHPQADEAFTMPILDA